MTSTDPVAAGPDVNAPNAGVVGVDYGTLSARAVVVRAADGAELGSALHEYAHGVIDRALAAGVAPAEWEFAKALQVLDEDPEIYARMELWVEAADWIVWQLCGRYVRNVCSTGYKAIHQDGQFPSQDYL